MSVCMCAYHPQCKLCSNYISFYWPTEIIISLCLFQLEVVVVVVVVLVVSLFISLQLFRVAQAISFVVRCCVAFCCCCKWKIVRNEESFSNLIMKSDSESRWTDLYQEARWQEIDIENQEKKNVPETIRRERHQSKTDKFS